MRFQIPLSWSLYCALCGAAAMFSPSIFASDVLPTASEAVPGKRDVTNPEQVFARLDRNRDGRLSTDEIPSSQQQLFNRLLRVACKEPGAELSRAEFLKSLESDDLKVRIPQNPGNAGGRGLGFNPEQFFQRADRNRDGTLTLDEIPEQAPPFLRQTFTRLKKTELTREEFLQAMRAFPAGNGGGLRRDPDAFFKRLNPDAEGRVNVANAPESFRPQIERWLRRLGRDKEGFITADDMQKIVAENRTRMPSGGTNTPAAQSPAAARQTFPVLLLRKLDTNGDGKLNKAELARAADFFDELDLNQDGELDAAELQGTSAERRNQSPSPP